MAFDYMHPPEDFEYLGEWCKAWRDPATGDWTISQLLDGLDTEQIILSGEEVRELARLAAQHDPTDYELEYGELRRPMFASPDTAYGSDADRFVVVEQFHNAFRRITTDWDSVLNRRTMDSNLERLLPLAAHTVRIEREGGSPDLRPMLDLCRKTHKAANRRTNRIAGEPDGPEHGYDVLP